MLTLLAESAINGIKHAQFPWLSLHLHMFFPFSLFIIYIFLQLPAFLGLWNNHRSENSLTLLAVIKQDIKDF